MQQQREFGPYSLQRNEIDGGLIISDLRCPRCKSGQHLRFSEKNYMQLPDGEHIVRLSGIYCPTYGSFPKWDDLIIYTKDDTMYYITKNELPSYEDYEYEYEDEDDIDELVYPGEASYQNPAVTNPIFPIFEKMKRFFEHPFVRYSLGLLWKAVKAVVKWLWRMSNDLVYPMK